MTRWLACALSAAFVTPLFGQLPPATTMTLSPAAEPVPALRYSLFPPTASLTPGNAAVLYFRAFSPESLSVWRRSEHDEQFTKLRRAPLSVLPLEKLAWLDCWALRQVDRAARRQYCHWELDDELRQERFRMLLPDVQGFRTLGNFLALRARLEMARGQTDSARATLQTGYRFSKHLGEGPTLVHVLIGTAVANAMSEQVETLIQLPDAPNLYWALTEIPRPLIDLRHAAASEQISQESLFANEAPSEFRSAGLPAQTQMREALRMLDEISRQPESEFGALRMAMTTAKFYPRAKRLLIAQGRRPEDVEAMPAVQAVLLYSRYQYQVYRDDLYKWMSVPYWKATPGLRLAQERLQQARHNGDEGFPFASMLLPALEKIMQTEARAQRRIAALRCVEAIRMYAATHRGAIPDSLAEITEVPVPEDPLLGQPFGYHAHGDHATLEAAAPPPAPATASVDSLRYELILRK